MRGAHLFRIIRDTDMVIQEDEADDLLETVDKGLKQLRYGALSLLEVDATMPRRVLNILVENFAIEEDVVVRTADRMGLGDWRAIQKLHRPQLKDAPFSPRQLWDDNDIETIFDQIRYQDHLVHHPFDSFVAVESFLRAAIADPLVVAIKMTLYRIGQNSPLVDLLIDAAEQGKQVAVLVELKARFDERNNIAWANRLEVGRHPRRLRPGQPEDALQAVPGGAQGARRHPPLRARRHRQLQPGDVAGSTPTSGCSPPISRSSTTCHRCSTT